jgi:methylated-DNA-[protein]-cysteine S-methyltransferase
MSFKKFKPIPVVYYVAYLESPLGRLAFVGTNKVIVRIYLPEESDAKLEAKIRKDYPEHMVRKLPTWLKDLAKHMREYFLRRREIPRSYEKRIDWSQFPEFHRKVLSETFKIPFGRTQFYGDIAQKIRRPRSTRAVGKVLGSNPLPLLIPCHRVVGRQKNVGGFSAYGGLRTKDFLLDIEESRGKQLKLFS